MQAANDRPAQRGAIVLPIAFALVALLAIIGLIVDLGRMFIVKAELQNAADACALAAARELTCKPAAMAGGKCPSTFLANATAAGIAVGNRNRVAMQQNYAAFTAADVTFSTTLSSGSGDDSQYLPAASGADPNSRYVMCSLQQPGITAYLVGLLGAGPQTVSARAVATLAQSGQACAIPLGICQVDSTPGNDFGLAPGTWYSGLAGPGAGVNGEEGWVDLGPSPGCKGGGAAQLACQLQGTGQCSPPAVGTSVTQAGTISGLDVAWNSRFGIYKNGGGNPTLTDAQPDRTGVAYIGGATGTWPAGSNAYGGAAQGSTQNLVASRDNDTPYQYATDPAGIGNTYTKNPTTSAQLRQYGGSRRIAVSPVIDCSQLKVKSGSKATVHGYACVMMLSPVKSATDIQMEFLGMADDPDSPCVTSGLPGGSNGTLVPTLVQ